MSESKIDANPETEKIYRIVEDINKIFNELHLTTGEVFFVIGLLAADAVLYTTQEEFKKKQDKIDTLTKVVDNNAQCLNELQAAFYKVFPPTTKKTVKKEKNDTNQKPN